MISGFVRRGDEVRTDCVGDGAVYVSRVGLRTVVADTVEKVFGLAVGWFAIRDDGGRFAGVRELTLTGALNKMKNTIRHTRCFTLLLTLSLFFIPIL